MGRERTNSWPHATGHGARKPKYVFRAVLCGQVDDGPTLDVNEAFKMAPSANRYLRSVLPRSIYVEVHPHVGG